MSYTIISDSQNERITWLTIPAEEALDEDLQKLFAKAREKLGFVPNVFVTYMVRPEHFRRWFNYFRELLQGESALSRAEREMIAVTVSSVNGCLYCLVSHGADLRMALEDEVLGDRITLDYRRAGLDERTTAMLDYAVKITRSPVECDETDVEHCAVSAFPTKPFSISPKSPPCSTLPIAWLRLRVCYLIASIIVWGGTIRRLRATHRQKIVDNNLIGELANC
jgi:uncharacterized peroxidase-related enzyme